MNRQRIYVNFKRFDTPASMGGVNRVCAASEYGKTIAKACSDGLKAYDPSAVKFVQFFPEAQIPGAVEAADPAVLSIGCQGVHREDVAVGGNFGAFTTLRPAAAMAALGARDTIIGHCEERNDKRFLLSLAGVVDEKAVNKALNMEVKAAQARGMDVLFCVGERAEEVENWDEVIRSQLLEGLEDCDLSKVVVAYEPVWSIGPGKTPADAPYIQKVARLVKETVGDAPVVYGGGLKEANAALVASIPEIDGGLIALTRFSGEIGFYPEEYLNIVRLYLEAKQKEN